MFITLRLMGPLNGSMGCLKNVFRQLRWLINHGNLQSWPCWRAIERHPMLLWVRPLFCSWEADLWEQSWMFFFLRIAQINSFKSELVWSNDRTKVNNIPIVREDLSSLKLQLETRWEWESLFALKKRRSPVHWTTVSTTTNRTKYFHLKWWEEMEFSTSITMQRERGKSCTGWNTWKRLCNGGHCLESEYGLKTMWWNNVSDKRQINQTKKICKGCRRIAALSIYKKKILNVHWILKCSVNVILCYVIKDKGARFHYVPLKCLFEIDLLEYIRVRLNMLFEKSFVWVNKTCVW